MVKTLWLMLILSIERKDAVVAEAKNAASGEVVFKVDYTETRRAHYTITEKQEQKQV